MISISSQKAKAKQERVRREEGDLLCHSRRLIRILSSAHLCLCCGGNRLFLHRMEKTKRDSKRNLDPCFPHPHPPRISGTKPCSSKVGSLSEEKLLQSVGSGELRHLPSIFGVKDCSKKLLKAHDAIEHQERRLESILPRRLRDRFGHHYSRRSSKNYTGTSTSSGRYTGTSTSRGKDVSTRQADRLSFKLPTPSNSESACYSEIWETHKPDRIESSSFVPDPIPMDVMKAVCRICEKPLRRKMNFLPNVLAPRENAVVAVLVCGHIYHADCLEQKTSTEDQCDPGCPVCLGLMDIWNYHGGKEKAVDII